MTKQKKLSSRRRRDRGTSEVDNDPVEGEQIEDELVDNEVIVDEHVEEETVEHDTEGDEQSQEEDVEGDDCRITEDQTDVEEDEVVDGTGSDKSGEAIIVPVEQNSTLVLDTPFGDMVGSDVESDDSGDDIFDNENIPDPLSSEDEEEECERHARQDAESPEEILWLEEPRSGYTKMLKPASIAQLYEERLRVDPHLTAKQMAADIKRNYNMTVDFEQSQRHAWKTYCRPIIGLDGAFLKWEIKGQLLAAVGRDADNRIVPIAWAVVEIENEVNWDWFVTHLQVDFGLGDGRDYAIISDKQTGLVKAIRNVLPRVEHRLCARHILGNWKRDTHDMELERIFWKIARSYTKGDYQDNLVVLQAMNPGAYQTLLNTNPETWSRAFFRVGSYCNDVLNNLNESFNRTIKEARSKLLLELLEDIRRQCRSKTRLTKNAHREIDSAITKSAGCSRYLSTGDMHEVHSGTCYYSVEMRPKTCGCGKWQMNGIPCENAACVIVGQKRSVEDFVSVFYTTKNWQLTHGIQPVQGMKLWPRLNRLHVLPPPFRNGPRGRPKTYKRRKSLNEKSAKKTKLSRDKRVMTCSNFYEEGHNKVTCKKDSVQPPAKKPRGRPRKDQSVHSQQGHVGSQMGTQGSQQAGSQMGTQGSQVGSLIMSQP